MINIEGQTPNIKVAVLSIWCLTFDFVDWYKP